VDADHTQAEEFKTISADRWCCIVRFLLLQEDFVNEKPLLHITSKAEGCVFVSAEIPL